MRKLLCYLLLLPGLVLFQGKPAGAAVKPHALFSENMVLQQGVKVPIWGTANPGEKVTVRLQDQEVSATANDGKWLVNLENLKAGGPFELTLQGENTIHFKNVLVGEVWICSGQSNMQWCVSLAADPKQTIAQANNPMLRLFTVHMRAEGKPQQDIPVLKPPNPPNAFHNNTHGTWLECNEKTVPDFTAVGYFFGLELQKARKVPVGLIHTSWGGTPAQAWTRKEVLAANPELKGYVDQYERAAEGYPTALKDYPAALQRHKEAVAQAKKEGKKPPQAPPPPLDPGHHPSMAATLYNAMIAPLIPYAIKGAIWYQGESNAFSVQDAMQYRTLFPAMIKNWRDDWKQGDFPFLFVQLAPWNGSPAAKWPELWESQLLTTKTLPNTGMAVITDLGDEKDIHPKKKQPVGARLALAARAIAYGEDIVYSGPIYDSMRVEEEKAILTFKHAGSGLMAQREELHGFTICGADKRFVKAQAKIDGDKIVVWSSEIKEPVAVRFGWENYPKPELNLFNKEGLPASPFRTDVPEKK